jgi:hypothetical protein
MIFKRPLPPGSVIEFCGEEATVISDNGGHKITVNAGGFEVEWYWKFQDVSCTVVYVPNSQESR